MNEAQIIDLELYDPALTGNPLNLELRLSVERYSHHVIGGPAFCDAEAYGREMDVAELVNKLRAPAIARSRKTQEPLWWGYLSGVELGAGVGVSLDNVANKIQVVYAYVPSGAASAGTKVSTTWAQNDDSVTAYGYIEHKESLSEATAAQAEQLRDRLLASMAKPQPTLSRSSGDAMTAALKLSGWWNTFDWRFLAEAGTDAVETTTQIRAAVLALAQYITGVTIWNASGVTSSEYREGDATLLEEVTDLLLSGTTNDRQLMATVDSSRWLHIREEPANTSARHILRRNHSLHTSMGALVPPEDCTIGVWADVDILPDSVNLSRLANISPVFIESAEYDARSGQARYVPRGQPKPSDLARLITGK